MQRFFAVNYCLATFVAALVALQSTAIATVYNLSPDDDWFSVNGCDGCAAGDLLQPGDEVILQSGIYSDPRRINLFHRGTAANPIVIRAAAGANPIFERPFDPTLSTNHVLNLEGAQHLTLRGLEVRGGAWGIRIGSTLRNPAPGFVPNTLPDAGPLVKAMARYITLENNYVHDTGANAITANMDGDDYEGIIIRNNEISNTGIFGEGLYLGCNNNNCQFHDGLIEGNYIHHLNGPLVDQGDGIEIKHGSYANVVRHNVIHDTRFPGILAYGTAGNGARNLFEGNIVWGSENQTMQIASDAIIRNNILLASDAQTLLIQNHQGATPGNLDIVNNTIIAKYGISVYIPSTVTDPILFANNALYSESNKSFHLPGLNNITLSGNVGTGYFSPSLTAAQFDPTGNFSLNFEDLDWMGPKRDAYPTANAPLVGGADGTHQPDVDFNGTKRSGSLDAGAYRFDTGGNTGWTVTEGFKQFPADFNRDFAIDELDLAIFRAAFADGAEGDVDNDGDTDGADFLSWQRRAQWQPPLRTLRSECLSPILWPCYSLVISGAEGTVGFAAAEEGADLLAGVLIRGTCLSGGI